MTSPQSTFPIEAAPEPRIPARHARRRRVWPVRVAMGVALIVTLFIGVAIGAGSPAPAPAAVTHSAPAAIAPKPAAPVEPAAVPPVPGASSATQHAIAELCRTVSVGNG
jgi:hypothetical protein